MIALHLGEVSSSHGTSNGLHSLCNIMEDAHPQKAMLKPRSAVEELGSQSR